MNLTALETKMVGDIVTSCYRNGPLEDNDPIWTFDVVDTAADKGVISSLIKKGLVIVRNWDGNDTVVEFTPTGLALVMEKYH